MIHVVYIWIIAVALFAGYMIGAVCWTNRTEKKANKKAPAVGYLQFNVGDPTKEFMELHITKDLDIEHPPEYVKLLVLVLEKGGESDGRKDR